MFITKLEHLNLIIAFMNLLNDEIRGLNFYEFFFLTLKALNERKKKKITSLKLSRLDELI